MYNVPAVVATETVSSCLHEFLIETSLIPEVPLLLLLLLLGLHLVLDMTQDSVIKQLLKCPGEGVSRSWTEARPPHVSV